MLRILPTALLIGLIVAFGWQAVFLSGEAATYPRILLGLIMVSLLAFLFQEARAGNLGRSFVADVLPESRQRQIRQAGFLVTWIVYLFALPEIGFILASWLAITASWVLVSPRGWLQKALITAVFTLTIAVLLKTTFFVPVPQGLLDERLDEIIYSLP